MQPSVELSVEWTPEIDIVPAMARVTDILTPGNITATRYPPTILCRVNIIVL